MHAYEKFRLKEIKLTQSLSFRNRNKKLSKLYRKMFILVLNGRKKSKFRKKTNKLTYLM